MSPPPSPSTLATLESYLDDGTAGGGSARRAVVQARQGWYRTRYHIMHYVSNDLSLHCFSGLAHTSPEVDEEGDDGFFQFE